MTQMRERLGLEPMDPSSPKVTWAQFAKSQPITFRWLETNFGMVDADDPGCDELMLDLINDIIKKEYAPDAEDSGN